VPGEDENVHVGLVVDHPKRDLPGAVMLGYQLARRGIASTIIPMYEQGVDIPRLGVDTLVLNYARESNKGLIERYAQAGLRVFVLDTEGGVLAEKGGNSPVALARRMKASGYGELLAGYFFWGSRLRDAFRDEAVLPPGALHVTGCPRFDFAAPRWRGLLDRPDGGYLLVNANFPLVNPRYSGSPDRERQAMIGAGWEAGYVDRLLGDLSAVFARYLEEIRRLAAARPRQRFLVRPHPFEGEASYREAFAALPNVKVDGEGSVLHVIRNCRAVLHLNCGTAIEAVMLGKLPIQLGHLDTPATAGHAMLPARISRRASSFEAALDIIDRLDEETAAFDFAAVHKAHIEAFFFLNDGSAAARVADVLAREDDAQAPSFTLRDAIASCRPSPSLPQLVKGSISLIAGSAAASSLRTLIEPRRREKVLDLAATRDLIADIARADAEAAPPIVEQARYRTMRIPMASLSIRAA
jgi:surface carbohydrate biosynthesis protein